MTPFASPVVSIIVATRNRPDLLSQCLEGIAAQSYEAVEVIVVDDGSNAATRHRYTSLCPTLAGRLKWLLPDHQDTPGTGPAAARNRGLQVATGTFVALCDDDDHWIRADHVATGVRALELSAADFYFTNLVASRDGEVVDYCWFPQLELLKTGRTLLQRPAVFAVDLDTVLHVVGGTVIHPDCWIVRRSLLNEVGGFWERLWYEEDYDLMMRLLASARSILFRSDPCADYRLPASDSVSKQSSRMEIVLQQIMAAQHIRLLATKAVVRRCARAREAWCLRRLAREFRSKGRRRDAWFFAWQGLCTYPTLGALRQCLLG
jgi:glycosyltransferase involved in cell wall biosynthesis